MTARPDPQQGKIPIIVDLDGTLVKTDTLLECLLLLLKQRCWYLLLLPLWLLKGKAYFKQQIVNVIDFDAKDFVYNQDVLTYIKDCRSAGHHIYLATGADELIANRVSGFIKCFDGIFASDGHINLTGSKKRQLLQQHFPNGFEYLGNSTVDLAVWAQSERATVVSPSEKLLHQAAKRCANTHHIQTQKPTLLTYAKAIRVHQWVKNALLLVPLFTAHMWLSAQAWQMAVLGFFAFSLAASSVYLLNDLLDLAADRQHSSKSKRPFAAGTIPLAHGIMMMPCFLLMAYGLAMFSNLNFMVALTVYYLITLFYSFYLKQIVMLDTVVLAALYTMRIIAGTVLVSANFSFWLLSFSMFIFLSLALLKRYIELVDMQKDGKHAVLGRGYYASDASMVASLGAASGYIAVLVMALYVHSPEVRILYQSPALLWLICPILLFWVSRIWLLAHRGSMHDDPIVFAVKDRLSLAVGVVIAAIFYIATQAFTL